MKRTVFSAVLLILLFGSCRTPKDIAYFQGIGNLTDEQRAAMDQKYTPRICIDDALVIYVTSPEREEVAQFSPAPFGYYMPGEFEIGIQATTQNLFTYIVDEFGEINFPVLGRIHVAGMSINEAIRMMEKRIWESAPNAIVLIQVANFKVGILGEVKMPNIYNIRTPRVSILDLIALAGDLTILADRKNVWVHRDNNGMKVHERMDLTDPMIFASPYYYLQQNDMVYILPNDAQKRTSKITTIDLSVLTTIISTLSILISAVLTVRGQNM